MKQNQFNFDKLRKKTSNKNKKIQNNNLSNVSLNNEISLKDIALNYNKSNVNILNNNFSNNKIIEKRNDLIAKEINISKKLLILNNNINKFGVANIKLYI